MTVDMNTMRYPAGSLPSSVEWVWDNLRDLTAMLVDAELADKAWRTKGSSLIATVFEECIEDRDEHWWPSDSTPQLCKPPRGYTGKRQPKSAVPSMFRPLYESLMPLHRLLTHPRPNSDAWWERLCDAGDVAWEYWMEEGGKILSRLNDRA